ncbi:hypothetical protein [Ahrensia kielensis]|uniref:hypothetical protein n=1 Tax=Ahrensia kielensis TaxID=76980 RepID=UPI00146DC946|nr:hypothetical protein [Ahrensia kielensis]
MDRDFSKSNWFFALILAIFFSILTLKTATNVTFPYINLDEQGHISYALYLSQAKDWFPELNQIRIYDFAQKQWSNEFNFINHPPLAYHLLNFFSDIDPPKPENRFVSVAFFSLGFWALLFGLHKTSMFSNLGLLAVTAFCILLKIHLFSATFTNDSIAFVGGAIVFLGTVMLWNKPSVVAATHISFALGGGGLVLCLAAKLNVAVLVGFYLLVSFVLFAWQENKVCRHVSKLLLVSLGLLCFLAALPYASFLLEFGSPAPNTAGQIKMLVDNFDGKRLDLGLYLFFSLKGALENAGPDAFITYTIFAGTTVITAIIRAIRPSAGFVAVSLQNIAIATLSATAFTFAVHIGFSYQRHLEYGWQPELYPRYYFPLLGPYLLLFFSSLAKLGPLRAFAQIGCSTPKQET